MADLKEARVPDIGGYDDVPVIEVLVAVGDSVARDQGLVTLESDKATMEVPSPFAGVVRELKVKLGDTLSEGSVVAMIEAAGDEAPAKVTATRAAGGGKRRNQGRGDRNPGRAGGRRREARQHCAGLDRQAGGG
jgi:pyruvate dehydrogenase E2 component (dihydrolipoamide acetyltransferase)